MCSSATSVTSSGAIVNSAPSRRSQAAGPAGDMPLARRGNCAFRARVGLQKLRTFSSAARNPAQISAACRLLGRLAMTPEQLRKRTKVFAIAIIRFTRRLPASDEARVIRRQLLRAGTAVGANYRAVCRPRSDADFIAKLGVVIEEADESAYWIELLVEAGMASAESVRELAREADELTRIFVASRETARANARARRQARNRKSRIKNHE